MSVLRREAVVFDDRDQGLRADVNALGRMVGELVREQGGESLFNLVETARRAAIERREDQEGAEARLVGLIDAMKPDTAREFIRAFSTYFQMVNTAEKVHRIRRRRDYLNDPANPQPNSFEDTLKRLKDQGHTLDDVLYRLNHMSLEPVLTPHPTEPTRRTLLRKQQQIVRRMIELLDPNLTPQERRTAMARIRMEATTGWQTEEHPNERMSVADELEHVLFFLTDVLYTMIPPFHEELEYTLCEVFGIEQVEVPDLLRFASWVGGDMAGNPEASAKTVREALARQRALALGQYARECELLADKLSQSTTRVPAAPELLERIEHYSGHFPNAMHAVPSRHREMPYRVMLNLMQQRLRATFDDSAYPYEDASEFLADLQLLADSLMNHRGRHAGLFAMQRLIRRVRTFGFHMLTLDIRQNAGAHRAAVGEGLGEPYWEDMPAEERVRRLQLALRERELPQPSLSANARKVMSVFKTIGFCRRKYGAGAIGRYVIGTTAGVDDVLSVLLLARWGELARKSGEVPLDLVPAFESVEALENAPQVMAQLLEVEVYRQHLAQRGGEQMIMVDYADSNRDSGVAAVRWSVHCCQQALLATMAQSGVELTFLHGRGGTVLRGGGKAHATVRTAPPGAAGTRFRATEPGELINTKFGLRGIAMRTFEQLWSAVLDHSMNPRQGPTESGPWAEAMDTLAATSRERYQRLVYGDPRFADYFRAATPADLIERMRIGSRPPAGTPPASLQNLRTIPWMFAWSQSRCLLPGWFGLGSGLAAAAERHGEDQLREMATSWYFLATLLTDVERVLATADIDIARRYSELADDLHDRFFPIVRQEFELTLEWVLRIKGQDGLLAHETRLRRAIRLRNPYVDPMSVLQVDLLRRWRAAEREDDTIFRALVASVNGISHGLQNV